MKRMLVLAIVLALLLAAATICAAADDYTVRSGDTLTKIARAHQVTVADLVLWNQIPNPDLIFPGQVVRTTPLAVAAEKPKPAVIPAASDIDPYGGADYYDNGGDHPDSMYYVSPDFYRMRSNDHLTILESFKTFQQTSEWSCGNAGTLMVLEHFGVTAYSEYEIAQLSGAHRDLDVEGAEAGTADNFPEYGTSVDDIVRFFEAIDGFDILETSYRDDYTSADLIQEGDSSYPEADWGNLPGTFEAVSLYASDNDPDTENWIEDARDSYFVKWVLGHLNNDRPILVEWGDWDGHWQVIIGYDTMGTPGIGDDIIIFADPYDTSDHWQDGYYYYPAERWFYMWQDRAVAPKPYAIQPYIVVDKAD